MLGVGSQLWGFTWKNKGMIVMQIEIHAFSIHVSFWRFSPAPLPGTEWETPLQMEICLLHVDASSRSRDVGIHPGEISKRRYLLYTQKEK